MCGITGIAFSVKKEDESSDLFVREMSSLFSDLLLSIEPRGKAATGIAILNQDDTIYYAKNDLPAKEFINTDQYYAIMEKVSADTISIIGHTRLPTNGPASNNNNNHPHVAGKTIGVHNGVIGNYQSLEAKWKLNTRGMCDSEVIFRLYDWIREKPKFDNKKTLQVLNEQLDGSYACAFFSLYEPKSLILFRGYGALETIIAEDKENSNRQVYIFNSERSNINTVLGAYDNLKNTGTTYKINTSAYLIVNPITWKAEQFQFKGETEAWRTRTTC